MNALCARVIGTLRRECLDGVIPISVSHLRSLLKHWLKHHNSGRTHVFLRSGIPDPPATTSPKSASRHRREETYAVRARPIVGELHHDYFLVTA